AADPFISGQFEMTARRRNGETFQVEITISETGEAAEYQRIAILRDITERKQHEARLAYLATYDSLTGLPNRNLFRDRLQLAMARTRRNGKLLALMFMDIDRFKTINDSLGHEIGDKLLQQVGALLTVCLRDTDSVSRREADESGVFRFGGDEFTILVEDLADVDGAKAVAQRVLNALKRPFLIDGNE